MSTDLTFTFENGIGQLSLTPEGDFAMEDSFDTPLYYSIYGRKRAEESEVPISSQREGWLGNQGTDFENGSKLWLYKQARITRTNLNAMQDEAYQSVEWLVTQGYLKDISASVSFRNGAVVLEIILYRFNSKVDSRLYTLWQNTGVSS
jgi:phage gp46-like protein